MTLLVLPHLSPCWISMHVLVCARLVVAPSAALPPVAKICCSSLLQSSSGEKKLFQHIACLGGTQRQKHSRLVMCPLGHLGLKAQIFISKGPNSPPRCSFLRSASHQGKPWMEKAKCSGWPPAAKRLPFGVQEGQTWCNELLPLNVCQTTTFLNFVLENAYLLTQWVLSLTK